MVIRVALLFLLFALISFFLGDVLDWFLLPIFLQLLDRFGIILLFCAFALLLATGLIACAKLILQALRDYFSALQRNQRHLLFVEYKQQQIRQLFQAKMAKIAYLAELRRKRLLRKNDEQHFLLLSKAVNQELLAIQQHIPASVFKTLYDETIRCKKSKKIDDMLKLRRQILSISQGQC